MFVDFISVFDILSRSIGDLTNDLRETLNYAKCSYGISKTKQSANSSHTYI